MKKRCREGKPLLPVLASVTGPALIKHLASCNTAVRSQCLRLIQSWLQSEPDKLSESDIKKLWKGLFYCLWHSDKTPNQVALIDRLTSLFLSLQPSLSLDFFRGFIVTLRREWPGIDRLRLDKFYLLIRRFVKAFFELMRLMKWDVGVLGEYFGVLEKDGFLAEDKLQGNGVNYHIVSVFVEELKTVGFPVRKDVVDVILGPFLSVLSKSRDRVLLVKVKSCLFDELLNAGKKMLENKKMGVDYDEKDNDVLLGVVALRMELPEMLYAVSSSEECVQGNRKVGLELHEAFLKLENEMELSGIEIGLPKYSDTGLSVDESDSEVPLLIPIDNNGESDDRRLKKKSKKVKKAIDGDDKNAKRKKKKQEEKREDNGVVSISDAAVRENGGVDVNDKKTNKKKKNKGKKREDCGGVSEIKSVVKENNDMVSANGINLNDDLESLGNAVVLNETVISNLQKQFEKVAAEAGFDGESDFSDTPLVSVKRNMRVNKRKRTKGAEEQESGDLNSNGFDIAAKSGDKSAKKVRFSMKNNLVWKPQNPLPPESLRLPPSVTPRGSAMKKGVPPGPVIETPPSKRKLNQKKRAMKRMKSATPMIKRRTKTITRSA